MQATLASLGIGPMPTTRPQGDTLEDELDDYLAAPAKYANLLEFWEVCRMNHFVGEY